MLFLQQQHTYEGSLCWILGDLVWWVWLFIGGCGYLLVGGAICWWLGLFIPVHSHWESSLLPVLLPYRPPRRWWRLPHAWVSGTCSHSGQTPCTGLQSCRYRWQLIMFWVLTNQNCHVHHYRNCKPLGLECFFGGVVIKHSKAPIRWLSVSHQPPAWIFCYIIYHHYFYFRILMT